MAKKKRAAAPKSSTTIRVVVDADKPALICNSPVSEGHDRFHQLGHRTRTWKGELCCGEQSALTISDKGRHSNICSWHYSQLDKVVTGQWPSLGDARAAEKTIIK